LASLQVFEERLHVATALRIEARRRLVEQQQRRVDHERACDADLLLHTAAHLLERRRELRVLHSELFENLHHAAFSLARILAVEQCGVEQVLARRQFLVEGCIDADTPDDPAHFVCLLREREVEHPHVSAIGSQQCRKNANQRRFAGTVWSEQPVSLALRDAERDVVDRPELGLFAETISLAKTFAQVAHLNSWLLHDQKPRKRIRTSTRKHTSVVVGFRKGAAEPESSSVQLKSE